MHTTILKVDTYVKKVKEFVQAKKKLSFPLLMLVLNQSWNTRTWSRNSIHILKGGTVHWNGDVSRFPWMLFLKRILFCSNYFGKRGVGGYNKKKMLLAFEVKLHFFQDFKAPVNLKVDGVVYFAIATIYAKGNLKLMERKLT